MLSGSTDLQGIKVAVYVPSAGVAIGSDIALDNMFTWMNASVDLTNSSHILAGGLAGYDILAFPGGSTFQYIVELADDGRQKVRDFVSNGGSYFGICGGARLGTNDGLGLFNGSYSNPVPGLAAGSYIIELTLNKSSGISGLSEEPDTFSTLYWGSTYFNPNNPAGILKVATYVNTSLAAMIAFQYGQGSVFLSSPHPEYEENSDRDGTSAFDYLNDTDSEWGPMLKVSRWLIDTSVVTTTTGTVTNPISVYVLVLSVAAIASVAIVIVVRRR